MGTPRADDAARDAATREIDVACQSLKELRRRLEDIVRQGGGDATPELLTAGADDCPDATIVCEDTARIRFVNGGVARITGLSTRTLQTLSLWDITHQNSQGDFDVVWKEFLRAGRQRGVMTVRHRDGDAVDVAYCSAINVVPRHHILVLRRLS